MKNLVWLVWIFALLGLSACNTTRGVGEDVEATGEAVQDTAEDTEDQLEDDDEDHQM